MKLYKVNMWFMDAPNEVFHRIIVSNNNVNAECEAIELDTEGYDCFEAEPITEINGYKVIFEKIEKIEKIEK